ncbi:MAG: hypothetical protein AMXMBFR84_29000 [Candidatus Hydrogenedentota bacterium]
MSLNILIVDDSATVRAVIARTLGHAGIAIGSVLHAANGREALDVLATQWVDLIITDIHMPEMDGIAMIGKLKSDPVLKEIPVIVVSTEGSASRMNEVEDLGVIAYLRKPFTPEKISEILQTTLGVQS